MESDKPSSKLSSTKSREEFSKAYFTEMASKFEDDAHIADYSEHGLQRHMSAFFHYFEHLRFDKGKKILDIGCGPGSYSLKLSRMGHEVTGMDYVKEAVFKAVKKTGDRVRYLVADAYTLPFIDNEFDIVTCIGVFQCISDEKPILNEINRVLTADGILILITLNALSLRALLIGGRKKDLTEDRRYNPSKLKKTLTGSGFTDIEIMGVYISPKPLIPLETLFDKTGIFNIIDQIPLISSLMAHSILIKASKK